MLSLYLAKQTLDSISSMACIPGRACIPTSTLQLKDITVTRYINCMSLCQLVNLYLTLGTINILQAYGYF